MSAPPTPSRGSGNRGRPKGSRNKKTIARLIAAERNNYPTANGIVKLSNHVAVLMALQQKMVGKNNEEAARLYDQITAVLEPSSSGEPGLFVLIPEVLSEQEWEKRASMPRVAPVAPARPKSSAPVSASRKAS